MQLTATDFTRWGFHVQHRPHGFDLACPDATETSLFRLLQTETGWVVHVHAEGLQELYPHELDGELFIRLLESIEQLTDAYMLPAGKLVRYLYLLNYVRLNRFELSQENVAMLANMPVSFTQQVRALHAAGDRDIYHVIKAAELNDEEFAEWQITQTALKQPVNPA